MSPRQPIGWVRWHAAILICSFSGRLGYDRRLDHKSRMGREFHVRFCEGLGVQFPRATRLVILCRTEAEAQRALAAVRAWVEANGLTLHPDKTRLVDATAEAFDFLGYRFDRGRRYVRPKSLAK